MGWFLSGQAKDSTRKSQSLGIMCREVWQALQSLASVQTEPHRKRNHTRLKTDGVLTLCSERCAEARTPGGAHDNDKVFVARGHKSADLTQTSYGRQQQHIESVERTGEEGEVNSLARQVLQQLDPTATVRLAASPLDRQPSTVQNFPHYWQVGAAAVEQC